MNRVLVDGFFKGLTSYTPPPPPPPPFFPYAPGYSRKTIKDMMNKMGKLIINWFCDSLLATFSKYPLLLTARVWADKNFPCLWPYGYFGISKMADGLSLFFNILVTKRVIENLTAHNTVTSSKVLINKPKRKYILPQPRYFSPTKHHITTVQIHVKISYSLHVQSIYLFGMFMNICVHWKLSLKMLIPMAIISPFKYYLITYIKFV